MPVRIVNPASGTSFDWLCLVDTGADSSLFPASIPVLLGHRLRGRGVRTTYSTGVGGTTAVWLHTFRLGLLHPRHGEAVVWRSPRVRIGCVESDGVPALLGTSDFLHHFRITLDYPAQRLTVAW